MSQNGYFKSFPIITYEGVQAVDITERVVFLKNILKNPYLFYPYDLADNERADQFSNRYYGDSYKSWILYLGNQMTDPYYEWYMSQDVFNQFIEKKYGSVQLAQQKTKYFENNWYNGTTLGINGYDALVPSLIKYWQPVYGYNGKLLSYERKPISQTINTNNIRSYTVANNSFKNDEICTISFNSNTSGQGQVLSVANNVLFLQHTNGNTIGTITSNSYIYGQESTVNTQISTQANVANNLLPEEDIYWSPVSYFDYETAKNEYNKSIIVFDSAYSANVVSALKSELK